MCAGLCVCPCRYKWIPRRPEEGIRSCGTGVTGGCEQPIRAGNWTQALCKNSKHVSLQVICLAPCLFMLTHSLTHSLRLALNSHCSPDRAWTCSLPACASLSNQDYKLVSLDLTDFLTINSASSYLLGRKLVIPTPKNTCKIVLCPKDITKMVSLFIHNHTYLTVYTSTECLSHIWIFYKYNYIKEKIKGQLRLGL